MNRLRRILALSCMAMCVFVMPSMVFCHGAVSGNTEIQTLVCGDSDGSVTAKWERISCEGYQLQYSSSSDFASPVSWNGNGNRATTKTTYNLTVNETYYFRVRAYFTGNNGREYGGWSAAKSIKAAKATNKQTSSSAGTSSGKNQSANEKARNAAVDWAIGIANDNSFHYGQSKWAHNSGCYYCGTNTSKGSAKLKAGATKKAAEKTYCCNPFVTAAYHHGAGAPEIDCRYSSKRINLANDKNKALNGSKNFKKISKPKKVTSLQVGDILLTPTHCMLYAGDGKVVHAAHHDNGKQDAYWNDSITVGKISANQWKRTSKIYRYYGNGRF